MGDLSARARRARRRPHVVAVLTVLTATALASCAAPPPPVPTPTVTVEPQFERAVPPAPEVPEVVEPLLDAGAVNAGHPAATKVGLAVLDDGGNAVDAAIATAFAVSVAEPFGSGLGGGGSAILVGPGLDPVNVDYRDVVPAGGVPGDFTGVPGLVAGLWHLHGEYGTLPWDRLVRPAVELARDGVPVSDMLHNQIRSTNGSRATRGVEHFRPGGAPLSRGELLVQEDLARSLVTIADDGVRALYGGELAAALTAAHPSLDAGSLADYEVQVSEPPRGQWAGYTVLGASPALPGPGFIQLLQLVEALDVRATTPGSAEYVNIVATALRRALRTMAEEVGDPNFVDVESERITDWDTNEEIARGLSLAGPDPRPDRDQERTSAGETTHLTVVDRDGLMVTMTNTLTSLWGSGRYVGGFFLNDQLNRFDKIVGAKNRPAPGRRTVSWSLPAIVLDVEGRPVLGIGSPAGQRIPAILTNVLTRWGLFDEDLQSAVDAPRFHAAGRALDMEVAPGRVDAAALARMGYQVTAPIPAHYYFYGSVQAVEVDWERGTVSGAEDSRREGSFGRTEAAPAHG